MMMMRTRVSPMIVRTPLAPTVRPRALTAALTQFIFAPGSAAMLALMGQLHRAAGEASYSSTSEYAANVATLWESITMSSHTGLELSASRWRRRRGSLSPLAWLA